MGILWNAEDDQHTTGLLVRIFSSSGICDEPLDQSSPKVKPSNPDQDNKEMVEIEERSSLRRDRDSSISQERVFSLEEVVADRGRSVTNGEKSVRLRSRSRTPMKIRDNLSHLLGWFHDAEAENDDDVNFENTNSLIDMNKVSFLGPDGVSKLKYYKPCSRLALISSDQYSTFNYEMDLLKSKINDFPLYFQWCFWVWNEKYIGIHSIIENCIDLKVACKTARELYENSKISIFKKGIIPRRKHPINIDGVSIDIQVDHDDAYDLFRSIIKIVTDGTLYKPDIDCTLSYIIN